MTGDILADMSAHDQMRWLAIISCSLTVLIIMMLLMPGAIEIVEHVRRWFPSKGSRHRAAHRHVSDPQGRDHHGDPEPDPQGTAATS